MIKRSALKKMVLVMVMIAMFNVSSIASAAAVDFGHGSGCQHTHSSTCYTYHAHSNCPAGWKCSKCSSTNVRVWTDNSHAGVQFQCNNCNYYKVSGAGEINVEFAAWLCGKVEGQNLTCSKSTYGNCIMPTILIKNDVVDLEWTNQDVIITYSGTQSGRLTFTNNDTQIIDVISSSGHRIQESVTVDNIDKVVPDTPSYQMSNA